MLRLNSSIFRYLASIFIQLSPPFGHTFPHRTPMWTPKSSRFPHAQLGVFADHAVIFRTQAREVAVERRIAEGAERHGSGGFLVPHDGCWKRRRKEKHQWKPWNLQKLGKLWWDMQKVLTPQLGWWLITFFSSGKSSSQTLDQQIGLAWGAFNPSQNRKLGIIIPG